MSIQTDLTRIKNAKAAIKAAVADKGVTVPDGTKVDGLAALIEGIEAGGLYPIYYKEVTFAEDMTSTYTVDTSDCPFSPEGRKTSWVVWQKGSSYDKGMYIGCSFTAYLGQSSSGVRNAGSGKTLSGTSIVYNTSKLKETKNGLNIEFTGKSYAFATAGTTYAILGIKLYK